MRLYLINKHYFVAALSAPEAKEFFKSHFGEPEIFDFEAIPPEELENMTVEIDTDEGWEKFTLEAELTKAVALGSAFPMIFAEEPEVTWVRNTEPKKS